MKKLYTLIFTLILFIPVSKAQKILISVDMEGIAGVVTSDQLGPSGFEYQRFREFMTNETLAAIEGARQAGAKEIIVADSHGNGLNLLIEKFPDDIKIIRSWPRRFGMVAGINEDIDGVILIGYHASTHNQEGVRAHTFSSAKLTRVAVNDIEVSEGMWAAMVCGQFNAPIIMISGDNIATSEVKNFLGNIETAVVKTALGFHSAETMTPAAAANLIREKANKAVKNIKSFKPYHLPGEPVRFDVSFKNYQPSQVLAYLPMVERIDSHSIRFVGNSIIEVADFFVFLMEYESSLAP